MVLWPCFLLLALGVTVNGLPVKPISAQDEARYDTSGDQFCTHVSSSVSPLTNAGCSRAFVSSVAQDEAAMKSACMPKFGEGCRQSILGAIQKVGVASERGKAGAFDRCDGVVSQRANCLVYKLVLAYNISIDNQADLSCHSSLMLRKKYDPWYDLSLDERGGLPSPSRVFLPGTGYGSGMRRYMYSCVKGSLAKYILSDKGPAAVGGDYLKFKNVTKFFNKN